MVLSSLLFINLTAAAIMLDEEGKFKHFVRLWLQRGGGANVAW